MEVQNNSQELQQKEGKQLIYNLHVFMPKKVITYIISNLQLTIVILQKSREWLRNLCMSNTNLPN